MWADWTTVPKRRSSCILLVSGFCSYSELKAGMKRRLMDDRNLQKIKYDKKVGVAERTEKMEWIEYVGCVRGISRTGVAGR